MGTASIPVRADVAWVCALALGLGYSAKPDEACVRELIAGARGSVVTLRQAQECLGDIAVTDPSARERTCRMLVSALRVALQHPVNARLRS